MKKTTPYLITCTNFIEAGRVIAANAPGNNEYSLTHAQPGYGRHYYRLKRIDKDERYKYSETRVLDFGKQAGNILLYPNPVQHTATVTGLEAGNILRVLGMDGRIISDHPAYSNTIIIDVNKFPSGIYLLQVIQESAVMKTIKFTKQ